MRRARFEVGLMLAVCTIAAAGCRDPESRAAAGLPIEMVDSLVLHETDSLSIGMATGLVVDHEGRIYVADGTAGHVVRFGADGRLLGTIGRKGEGPGELGAPGVLALAGDSLLIVVDLARRRASAYSIAGGDFRRSSRTLGVPVPILSAAAHGDVVWIGLLDPTRHTAAARWNLRTDSIEPLLPLPQEYQGTGLEYAQPVSVVLPRDDGIVLGFTGHPDLFVFDTGGRIRDTVSVPVRVRRGVPRDLAGIYRRDGIGENEVSILSILTALHELESGAIAAVYIDISPVSAPPRALRTDSFLSLLDVDGGRACVDLPLPPVDGGRPVVAFRGDTVMMVRQHITDDSRAELVFQSFALNAGACPATGGE